MPHTLHVYEGICQVVVTGDEPSCLKLGRRGDNLSRHLLCDFHNRDYGQRTNEYKETGLKGEFLYGQVTRAQDLHDENLPDLEEALKTASSCVETLGLEIRQRQDHHKRFFPQADDKHKRRIRTLQELKSEVEETVEHLRQRKAALKHQKRIAEESARAKEERIAEEMRVAEEMRIAEQAQLARKTRLAEAQRRLAEEIRRLEAEKRLADAKRVAAMRRHAKQRHFVEKERDLADERRIAAEIRLADDPHADSEPQRRLSQERQLAESGRELSGRLSTEECPAEERRVVEAARRGSRALSTGSSPFPTRTYHYDRLLRSTVARTSLQPTRPVCVAYHTHASKYGRVRCAEEPLHGTNPRCQQHTLDYDRVLSELRTAKDEHRDVAVMVYYIHTQQLHKIKACTLAQVTQSIADITRYLSLADTIKVLATTVRRLEGYPQSTTTHLNMTAGTIDSLHPLSQDDIEDLLAELHNARSKLLMPGRARSTKLNVVTPAQYSEAAATQNQTTTTSQISGQGPWSPSESEHEEADRVEAKIATKVAHRLAAFFRLRRH